MKWADFLRYSKYIAVFYAAAFIIGILGIWMEPHGQWIWTAVMFFGAALAGNIALACYQYNHKGAMLMAKNDYLLTQEEAPVITSANKGLATTDSGLKADMAQFIQEEAEKAWRDRRGY